jgi:hypothetical protein
MDIEVWVGTISALLGIGLGSGLSYWSQSKNQKAQLHHSDRQQWDRDVVAAVVNILQLVRELVQSGERFQRLADKESDRGDEETDKLDAGLVRMEAALLQLQVIAKQPLVKEARLLLEMCLGRFIIRIVETDSGRNAMVDSSIDVEGQARKLLEAARVEIRTDP